MHLLRLERKYVLLVILVLSLGTITFFCKSRESEDRMNEIGYIKSRNSLEITQSYWGIQAGTLDEKILERARDIGVKWTRLGASWPLIEQVKGQYNWTDTDQAFDAVLKMGITPFVTLGGANSLYTEPIKNKDPELAEIYGIRPEPPTANRNAMDAWLRFVAAAVQRYQSRIKYWEIWNEPNHKQYWGVKPDGKEYGRLLKESALVIRKIDPEAFIIGGATAGLDSEYIDDFLSMGTWNLIDIVTFHNYGTIPEERIYKAIKVWDVIKKYNPQLELWQGECGYPSHSSTRDYRGLSPWGPNIQAKWLLRQAFTDVYFCRAMLSNYFKLVDMGKKGEVPKRSYLSAIDSVLGFPERGGSRVRGVGTNEKCLLTNPELNPKPAYYAYQNLCALMDIRYQSVILKSRLEIKDPGMFYGIGPEDDAFPSVPLTASFKTKEGALLIAYWLPWHPQELVNPARVDLILDHAEIEDPVLVDLLNGKVYQLASPSREQHQTLVFHDLPLFDYPCVIAERKQVEIVKGNIPKH